MWNYQFFLLYGEEESTKVIEHIKLFSENNRVELFPLQNRKHVIYKKDNIEEYEEIINLLKTII